MTQSKYWKPIKILGTASIAVLLFGLLIFPFLSEQLLSEDSQDSVLVSAVPFVAVFVTIILVFILLIFMVALRFNRLIPYRTYRPIESLIVYGILSGVFFLFQPWELISFRYGFLWLLASTITFILWSHVVPHTAKVQSDPPPYSNYFWGAVLVLAVLAAIITGLGYGAYIIVTGFLFYILWSNARPNAVVASTPLPSFTSTHYIVAGVLGLIVLAITTGVILDVSAPHEPYGYTQRQWDRGLRDEQKQAIIDEAESTYQEFTIPFAIFMGLIPASAIFFLAREAAVAMTSSPSQSTSQPLSMPTSG